MILLDTNALIWGLSDPKKFPKEWLEYWNDPELHFVVSAASIWEIAIKSSKRPYIFQLNPLDVIAECEANGFMLLDITIEHAARVQYLPWHHNDPFDRMIITQAQQLNLKILTSDNSFGKYNVDLLS